MTFQPRMHNDIEGFSVIGGLKWRHWNGITCDLWDVECASYAGGRYLARDPRLFILLETQGHGKPTVRQTAHGTGIHQDSKVSPISYIPGDVEMWLDVKDVETIRHLDIHFDVDAISKRLGGENLNLEPLKRTRLSIGDQRSISIARLIAEEVANPDPLHNLYGEGLALSLLIDILQLKMIAPRKRGTLAQWQLRRVRGFIEEHCLRNIRLEELASLTGLSQSHFSHSFKASTGMAPHEWQMVARLERAKLLLARHDYMLTAIAAETGFADHAHFSRTFRKHIGVTPSQWRKSHCRSA